MKQEKRKLTAAEKFGKMKRTEADKDLSRSERKNLYKEWREDEKLARERDQTQSSMKH
jgi:hypothetical protein